jgi:hypothetical protein
VEIPLSLSSVSRFAAVVALVAPVACAESPAVVTPPATPPPAPAPAPAPVSTAPADRPAGVGIWLHVEKPSRFGALARDVKGGPAPDASCAKGDVWDCLDLVDASRPLDLAAGANGSDDDEKAGAFSVESLAAFRERAGASFGVSEPRPGTLRLARKTDSGTDDGDRPVVCDVTGFESSHRIVCGNEGGVAYFGPWLRGSPRPASAAGLATAELFAGPVVSAVEKKFASGSSRDTEVLALVHDFAGATFRLDGAEAPGAPFTLDVDLRLKSAGSRWTQVLLAPGAGAGGGPIPDAFGRLSMDSTAVVYVPGSGPLAALLDKLGALAELANLDAAKARGAVDGLRAVLGKGAICAHAIDLEEARAELGRARKAPEKDRKKAEAAIDAAFDSHVVCGVAEPVDAAMKLARKLLDAAPKTPGETDTIRPAAGLGLPKGSFVVESTTRPEGTAAAAKGRKPPVAKTSVTLAVPDSDTTWIVSGEELHHTARFATRLLQQPKGALAGIEAPPGTLIAGYVSSLLGAFTWDLVTHSLDGLDASLATSSPGRLGFSLSEHAEGAGGTVSLRVTSDVPTVKALAARAAPLAFLVLGAMALSSSASDAAGK